MKKNKKRLTPSLFSLYFYPLSISLLHSQAPPTPPQAVLVGGDVNTLVKAPGHFHGEKGEPVKNMFPDNYQVRFPIQVGHGAPGLQVVTPGAVAGQQVVPPAGVQANQAYFQVASPHNFQVKKPESVQIRNPGPIQIRYPPQLQVVNPSQSQVAKPGQSQVTGPNQYQVVKAGQSQVAIPSQSQVANQGGLPIRAPIRLQSSPAGSERQANGTNYPFDLDLSSLDVSFRCRFALIYLSASVLYLSFLFPPFASFFLF